MKISTAVIGLGKVGFAYDFDDSSELRPRQIMTHCRSIQNSGFFKIDYLVEPNIQTLQKALFHFGGHGAQSLDELDVLIPPELVIVAVPTTEHLNVISKAYERWQPKVFLIEKPFGSSSIEARKIKELIQSGYSRVYVNYFRRYLPNFIALKSSAFFAERGNLILVQIKGYGTLENIFSHFFDLIIFFESSSILGNSKKTDVKKGSDKLEFTDECTGIFYELYGLGVEPRDCEMSLMFENRIVSMTSNGRCLEIQDSNGKILDSFILDEQDFKSYQAFVLSKIEAEFNLNSNITCMEDAIHIHEFIESIY